MKTLPKERQYLVLDNLNLVHYVLNRQMHIYQNHPEYEDYYHEGLIGLTISATHYDETRGTKFSTFACPNIRGYMLRYLYSTRFETHMSRNLRVNIFKVIKYISQGYEPDEIQEITGISEKDIQEALRASAASVSLDAELQNPSDKADSGRTLIDTVGDSRNYYEEFLSEENILASIASTTETLTSGVHRDIWEEYIYSIMFGEKVNQQHLADKYEVTQSYVCRVLSKAKKEFVKFLSKNP